MDLSTLRYDSSDVITRTVPLGTNAYFDVNNRVSNESAPLISLNLTIESPQKPELLALVGIKVRPLAGIPIYPSLIFASSSNDPNAVTARTLGVVQGLLSPTGTSPIKFRLLTQTVEDDGTLNLMYVVLSSTSYIGVNVDGLQGNIEACAIEVPHAVNTASQEHLLGQFGNNYITIPQRWTMINGGLSDLDGQPNMLVKTQGDSPVTITDDLGNVLGVIEEEGSFLILSFQGRIFMQSATPARVDLIWARDTEVEVAVLPPTFTLFSNTSAFVGASIASTDFRLLTIADEEIIIVDLLPAFNEVYYQVMRTA